MVSLLIDGLRYGARAPTPAHGGLPAHRRAPAADPIADQPGDGVAESRAGRPAVSPYRPERTPSAPASLPGT